MARKPVALLIHLPALLLVPTSGFGESVCATSTTACQQLKQYIAELQGDSGNRSLREQIIKMALNAKPDFVIPTEALEHEGGAEYLFKNSKTENDYARAAQEYERALLIAPWVAADYYNLGVAWEKAKKPGKAIPAFQLYLLAAPGAPDATDVLKRIGGLKVANQQVHDEYDWPADPVEAEKLRRLMITARSLQGLPIDDLKQPASQQPSLDPLIPSLNGAVFGDPNLAGHYSYEIHGNEIAEVFNNRAFGRLAPHWYPIEGRTFTEALDPRLCLSDYNIRATKCEHYGIINDNEIAIEYRADGRVMSSWRVERWRGGR